MGGLEQRDGGLWPAFDIDLMVAALEEVSRTSYWDAGAAVRCPILIVRAAGGDGWAEYQRMVELQPNAQLVEIVDAGHDVHLDQPQRWREALERFLSPDQLTAEATVGWAEDIGWVPPSLYVAAVAHRRATQSGETRTRG